MRVDIPIDGPSMAWCKHLEVPVGASEKVNLCALAYRSSAGGVTLGLSSEFAMTNGSFNMEIVLEHPGDQTWWSENAPAVMKRKWFRPVAGYEPGESTTANYIVELTHTIEPIRTEANNAFWFHARSFSLTSSTSDALINFWKTWSLGGTMSCLD